MYLYPRLPGRLPRELAGERARQELAALEEMSATTHPAMIYAPTGGNRVPEPLLQDLQQRLRGEAIRCGYPEPPDDAGRRQFDAASARILYECMQITPYEASAQGVWAFMTCVLLPDLVRWRFPGGQEGTTVERFLGGVRGIRNTFGRVWWRAHLLRQEGEDPYLLLSRLGEDELVQIMERPNLAGSARLARTIYHTFLTIIETEQGLNRSDLMRDVMKRVRRTFPVVSFDGLEEEMIELVLADIFDTSLHSLTEGRVRYQPGRKLAAVAGPSDADLATVPDIPSVDDDLASDTGSARGIRAPRREHNQPAGDPLYEAVRQQLPEIVWRCHLCHETRTLIIRGQGPALYCDNVACAQAVPVASEIVAAALDHLGVRCGRCRASLQVDYGKFMLRCTRDPDCQERVLWIDLHAELRRTGAWQA